MPHTANSSAHTATTTCDDSRSRSNSGGTAYITTSLVHHHSSSMSRRRHSSTHAITSTTHALTRTHLCIRVPADARRADTHSHLRRHDSHIGTRHQCSTYHQPHTHAHTHTRTHTSTPNTHITYRCTAECLACSATSSPSPSSAPRRCRRSRTWRWQPTSPSQVVYASLVLADGGRLSSAVLAIATTERLLAAVDALVLGDARRPSSSILTIATAEGFSPLWLRSCFVMLDATAARYSQYRQPNGFSPVWMRSCFVMSDGQSARYSQYRHPNRFTPAPSSPAPANASSQPSAPRAARKHTQHNRLTTTQYDIINHNDKYTHGVQPRFTPRGIS
jgi:hypothetical protein